MFILMWKGHCGSKPEPGSHPPTHTKDPSPPPEDLSAFGCARGLEGGSKYNRRQAQATLRDQSMGRGAAGERGRVPWGRWGLGLGGRWHWGPNGTGVRVSPDAPACTRRSHKGERIAIAHLGRSPQRHGAAPTADSPAAKCPGPSLPSACLPGPPWTPPGGQA